MVRAVALKSSKSAILLGSRFKFRLGLQYPSLKITLFLSQSDCLNIHCCIQLSPRSLSALDIYLRLSNGTFKGEKFRFFIDLGGAGWQKMGNGQNWHE